MIQNLLAKRLAKTLACLAFVFTSLVSLGGFAGGEVPFPFPLKDMWGKEIVIPWDEIAGRWSASDGQTQFVFEFELTRNEDGSDEFVIYSIEVRQFELEEMDGDHPDRETEVATGHAIGHSHDKIVDITLRSQDGLYLAFLRVYVVPYRDKQGGTENGEAELRYKQVVVLTIVPYGDTEEEGEQVDFVLKKFQNEEEPRP